MKAFLILEDGAVFEGTHIGAEKEIISEIVFHTSMAGYPEVLTDPSYAGQAVCMTYPLIGNYGVCLEDMESHRVWTDGLIVRELSRMASNFRKDVTIQEFLAEHQVPGIAGIDTRALTKLLRNKGTMNGLITTNEAYDLNEILPRIKAYSVGKATERATCSSIEKKKASGEASLGKTIAVLDLGMKKDPVQVLLKEGFDVTIYPAFTRAEEILKDAPDGILLSDGPGDPAECGEIAEEIKKLYDSEIPMLAICLGHQLLALSKGAKTFKMKYGHRGASQPVKDLENGRVYITSQNHGYAVDDKSVDPAVAVPSFINVNDKTNEGLSYIGKKIISVQFMPEAFSGSWDANGILTKFMTMMEVKKNA